MGQSSETVELSNKEFNVDVPTKISTWKRFSRGEKERDGSYDENKTVEVPDTGRENRKRLLGCSI